MMAVQVIDLSFAYNGRRVLDGLSLNINTGERAAVLGPNGAGKTTLLKLISGVLIPARGSVLFEERSPRSISRRDLARKIAVVPQEFGVPFDFTTREIVELGRTPHLRPLASLGAADHRAIERALEWTGTARLAERRFNELSGGERRRVIMAMALAQEPEVLLLDEPTQQLDITRQAEILDLIVELNLRQRLTVVAAIHDLNLAARYFPRLVVLHDGSVLADGPPDRVLCRDTLEKAYEGPIEILQSSEGGTPWVLPRPRFPTPGRKS